MKEAYSYKKAGVDVEAGYSAVERIKVIAKKTLIPGVLGGLGSFGGMFELPTGYRQPVLVSGTDGVGTKLKIAFELQQHHTIGIDCVAMCVNDILCQGARPLFFLDYIATGKLNPEQVAQIVEGIGEGCMQAGCALLGGETAEMPDFYENGEYDVAGFAVGIVEKDKIMTSDRVQTGDALIALPSSGVHSNGFSLVRKVLPHDKETLETLLTPTKIYVKTIQSCMERFDIHSIAHVTGGGLIENIPRILSSTQSATIWEDKLVVHDVFHKIQAAGNIPLMEMYNTFNMGVGMVLAVSQSIAGDVVEHLASIGEDAYIVGVVEDRKQEGAIRFA